MKSLLVAIALLFLAVPTADRMCASADAACAMQDCGSPETGETADADDDEGLEVVLLVPLPHTGGAPMAAAADGPGADFGSRLLRPPRHL